MRLKHITTEEVEFFGYYLLLTLSATTYLRQQEKIDSVLES